MLTTSISFPLLSGQNFNLRQLGICEPSTRRGLAFCAEMGLPHRGYSVGAGSDVDTENEGVMSPERAMRLWGRGVKSGGRNSCLSSRSNSALTLTDTEHENKSDSDNGESGRCAQHTFLFICLFYLSFLGSGHLKDRSVHGSTSCTLPGTSTDTDGSVKHGCWERMLNESWCRSAFLSSCDHFT